VSKVVCHESCEGKRCFGLGINECCNPNCLGGCTGPQNTQCTACKKLRIYKTGECVDECPKTYQLDPITNEMVVNPDGLYQYGITCVKTCPGKKILINITRIFKNALLLCIYNFKIERIFK
jgi:receptor tyrosine-protein kinase erbB-3